MTVIYFGQELIGHFINFQCCIFQSARVTLQRMQHSRGHVTPGSIQVMWIFILDKKQRGTLIFI